MAGKKQNYTDDFKIKIVELRKSGKSSAEIAREYQLAKSTVSKWVSDFNSTGSFMARDNRSEEENELIKLRKENKQLLMENDILKQAELIMARK